MANPMYAISNVLVDINVSQNNMVISHTAADAQLIVMPQLQLRCDFSSVFSTVFTGVNGVNHGCTEGALIAQLNSFVHATKRGDIFKNTTTFVDTVINNIMVPLYNNAIPNTAFDDSAVEHIFQAQEHAIHPTHEDSFFTDVHWGEIIQDMVNVGYLALNNSLYTYTRTDSGSDAQKFTTGDRMGFVVNFKDNSVNENNTTAQEFLLVLYHASGTDTTTTFQTSFDANTPTPPPLVEYVITGIIDALTTTDSITVTVANAFSPYNELTINESAEVRTWNTVAVPNFMTFECNNTTAVAGQIILVNVGEALNVSTMLQDEITHVTGMLSFVGSVVSYL